MIDEILENFDFFSNLTQRTLSAFHISGTDDTLVIDIEHVKKYLNGPKYKVLKNIIPIDNLYKRIFTDDTFDIVSESDIQNPVLIDKVDIDILKVLDKSYNPITHIKYGKGIILAHNKKIEEPNEYLFFIDMLDCID